MKGVVVPHSGGGPSVAGSMSDEKAAPRLSSSSNENFRCGALYSLGGVSSLPVAERGVVGSDVLEPAAPSAPSPAALPASPCTAWIESDWKPWPPADDGMPGDAPSTPVLGCRLSVRVMVAPVPPSFRARLRHWSYDLRPKSSCACAYSCSAWCSSAFLVLWKHSSSQSSVAVNCAYSSRCLPILILSSDACASSSATFFSLPALPCSLVDCSCTSLSCSPALSMALCRSDRRLSCSWIACAISW
mmetsp:Transcript_27389/g.65296  ORF Transcript_27389/g.65296 Transcript_27389/m.65296 type:complete len:245 (-) Transcript_27389:444-1178(-)